AIGDTHLEPFYHFPSISLKVDDVRIYETKADSAQAALDVEDIYVSLGLIPLLVGQIDVQSLLIEEGFFNLVMHEDGSNNIQNALASATQAAEADSTQEVETSSSGLLDFHLKELLLRNLDIHTYDEATGMDIEAYVYDADGGFKIDDPKVSAHIDTKFELNVINNGDTTFVKHKHFEFHTDVAYNLETGFLAFEPSGLTLEHGDFELEGTIDTQNDMTVDISVKGTKPNFDMFIAFAPEDLIPLLEKYNNEGNIYFNAVVQGATANGNIPYVDANFGASEAFLENTQQEKRLDDLGFIGHFTTGEEPSLENMEFSVVDMKATLEEGSFLATLIVKNFEQPDIDMQLDSDFNLEFLSAFLNLEGTRNAKGRVALKMRFHDIIDLDEPEKALNELDQAYFSELLVENLSLTSDLLPVPLDTLNLHLIMNGKKADLDRFDLHLGGSDVSITGWVSDLPAILHHSDSLVEAHMSITANQIDIAELTEFSDSTGFDEQIEDLNVGFSFVTSARAVTESQYLPRGEFFIDSLHAQLKHYPHELHDFHVDIKVDDEDLTIMDFTGYLDDSDFHFNGLMHDYGFWMQPELNGDVDLDITLRSDLLRLEDIFTYQGENYVPEDYRHEELEGLVIHGNSSMHFKQSELHSIDLDLDRLEAKMHLHPLKFERFSGRFHYEDDHLVMEDFKGTMGRTEFEADMNYYLGDDPTVRKRDNLLDLYATYVDLDQLTNFNMGPEGEASEEASTSDSSSHEDAYNLYDLPFTDMTFLVHMEHFIYHRVDLQNIKARLRSTQDHYIYVDTLSFRAADGNFGMNGYFNGSDPDHIYLKPKLRVEHADIDRLLFKFESHGEDEPLSENIHGSLTADIEGNILIYPDFVPNLDESEIHMDIQVLEGRLVNYSAMEMLSDYMGNKDLTNIRFDTLTNHMDMTDGVLTIPNMTIESTIGHFELSGQQDMDFNLEYYLRIPWTLITQGTRNKLFGGKKDDPKVTEDEIVKYDPARNVRFLNLKIAGNIDDYSVGLGKEDEE
ncbi:MAG TPA: hypothetical protein DCE41_03475, partial [Cytophagales bacterium]|nr:hypothetical protein [Cytophagales bacterium]